MQAILLLSAALLGAPPAGPSTEVEGAEDFRRRLENLERYIFTGSHAQVALQRSQNRWFQQKTAVNSACLPEITSLAGRARKFGQAARDAFQSGRVEFRRLQALARSPAVTPLIHRAETARLTALGLELDSKVERWVVAAGWQRKVMEPWVKWCGYRMEPGPGFASATKTDATSVALIILDGKACGDLIPMTQGVYVSPSGTACRSDGPSCSCIPRTRLPGAVLGKIPDQK